MAEARKRLGTAPVVYCGIGDHDVYVEDRWELRGVVARHNEVVRDANDNCHCTGFLVKCGPFTIYHSGDTLWHEDIVNAVLENRCDLMLLPINGNKAERRVAGNLNGTEAAALAKVGRARLVVPCHYDMFEFNTETPEEFERACARLEQPCRVLRCGERLDVRKAI